MQVIAAKPGSPYASIEELPEPEIRHPKDVLVRTRQLGVCGTDREILASLQPACPKGESFLALGHECLGEVLKVGTAVHEVRPGDLVVPVVRRPLPGARRRTDMLALGEFTERGIFYEHGFSQPTWLDRPEYLIAVPSELSEFAVFTEPLAVVEKGIHEAELLQDARLGPDAWPHGTPRVLVTGLGPIAFAGILASDGRDWKTTVFGRDARGSYRASLAESLGARYVESSSWVVEPPDVERHGFDLILECTGSDEALVRVAPSLASCGVMVWLGSVRVPRPKTHNLESIMRCAVIRNHLHLGSVNAARRDFQSALNRLHDWRKRASDVVAGILTEHVPFAEALSHYHDRRPQGIKCVIEYA